MLNSSILDHIRPVKKQNYQLPKDASSPRQVYSMRKTSQKKPELEEEVPKKQINVSNTLELPSISKRTLDLVKKVQEKREKSAAQPQPFKQIPEDCEPLTEDRLPSKLRILVKVQECLDSTLNLFSIRRSTAFFSELKLPIESLIPEKFKMQHVLNIMALEPLYSLSWAYNDKTKQEELVINLNSVSSTTSYPYLLKKELEGRRSLFVAKLLDFIRSSDFRGSSSGHKLPKHGNLEGMDFELPMADIPHRPSQLHPEPLSKILERMDKRQMSPGLIEEKKPTVLDRLRAQGLIRTQTEIEESSAKIPMSSSDKVSSLRERIIAKIKEKEDQTKKELALSDEQPKFVRSELVDFASMIKLFYAIRKVKNMFFVKVVEHLERNYSKLKSNLEVAQAIRHLVQTVPEWLGLIDNPSGLILRINSDLDMLELEKRIK
jgi:hypothetical protein